MALHDALRTMIDGRAGTWGVYARHLQTGETVAIRADEVMPAQSSLKVSVLLTYTKRVRIGQDDPDRRVRLLNEDHELGSGVLRYLAPGLSPTLDDLAWLMVVLSDNIATRALIRELGGPQVIEAEMDALGVPHLRLHELPQDAEYKFMATPRDLAEVYTHLDDHAREILYRVEKGFLARRVPHWPDAIDWGLTAPVRVYGKAGWGLECVDAGLFETDECSWVVAAMGKDLPDSGTDSMMKALARSPTSAKPSTARGDRKHHSLTAGTQVPRSAIVLPSSGNKPVLRGLAPPAGGRRHTRRPGSPRVLGHRSVLVLSERNAHSPP